MIGLYNNNEKVYFIKRNSNNIFTIGYGFYVDKVFIFGARKPLYKIRPIWMIKNDKIHDMIDGINVFQNEIKGTEFIKIRKKLFDCLFKYKNFIYFKKSKEK